MPNTTVMLHNNEGPQVGAAHFDGSSYMSRVSMALDPLGTKTGLFSVFARLANTAADHCVFVGGDSSDAMQLKFLESTLQFQIILKNPAGSTVMDLITGNLATDTWYGIQAAWDLATPGNVQLLVNGVPNLTVNTFVNDKADIVYSNYYVGAKTSGASYLGDMAEFYWAAYSTVDYPYFDLSVLSNLRKFYGSDGQPVNVGVDAVIPTGVWPLVYFHLDPGETPANFSDNRAPSNFNFAITGALTNASTSPSD